MLSSVARMRAAGISDIDVTLLDVVTGAAIGDTAINGVLVVEATASRVKFQQLVTHPGCW